MAFMDKSFGVTRLRLTDLKRDTFAEASARLLQFSFKPIDDIPETQSIGWVNIDDMLDSSWVASPPQKGAYLAFAMRIDTRRVPSAVVAKELKKALAEEEARNRETGKKFISRERKKELLELITLRLKRVIPPVPKVVDAIVDEANATVYLATTSQGEVEAFQKLFTRTFDTHALHLNFYEVAISAFPEKTEQLDALEDVSFGASAGAGDLSQVAGAVLGRDFLTFAWFFSEFRGGEFTGLKEQQFSLAVLDSVTVDSLRGKISASSGKTQEDDFAEAKLGIAKGKKVSTAKIRMGRDAEAYIGKIDSGFAVSGLRLPPVDAPGEDDDPDGAFFERMYLVETFWEMLDTAYIQFLFVRLDAEMWKDMVGEINLWLRQSVTDNHIAITEASHEHTGRIYAKWFEMIAKDTKRESADNAPTIKDTPPQKGPERGGHAEAHTAST